MAIDPKIQTQLDLLSRQQGLTVEVARALARGDTARAIALILALDPVHNIDGSPKAQPAAPPAGPAPPAPSTALLSAIDVSSAQGYDIGPLLDRYNPDLVVLHLYTNLEAAGLIGYPEAQAKTAQARGKKVAGYFWAFGSSDPEPQIRSAVATAAACGFKPTFLAADCEVYRSPTFNDNGPTDPAWLRAARAEYQRQGLRPALYTGAWWMDQFFKGGRAAFAEFSDFLLWLAWYGTSDITIFPPLPGFTSLAGKQYTDNPVDQSVFRSAAIYPS